MRRLTGTVCFYVLVLCGFAGVAAVMVRSAPRAEPRPVGVYAEQAVPPLQRGRRAFLQRDHARALFYLNEAIRLEPENADAYSLRGLAHAARGESDAAKSDFDEAIRLNPEDVKAYLERARVLAAQKNHRAAAADYSKCIELDPVEPEHFTARAGVYEKLREGKKAEADYTDAIRLAPTPQTHNDRALHYLFRGMYQDALADCNKAVEADPAYAMGHYHRACAYDGLGDSDRAIASASEALRIEFRFHEALALRGRLYARKKEYQAALIDFSQAIQFAPSTADYYRWRAEVLQALGEANLAAQDLQLAAQLTRGGEEQ
jgi:tetratricopeptide (TPR) repeat protein